MTIGADFRLAAQEIIYDFSTELGNSTFYSKTADGYNTTTGLATPVFTSYSLLIVSDQLVAERNSTGYPGDLDPKFIADHRLILIAGLDLAVIPKEGDEIMPVNESKRYRVDKVDNDQYGALYTCYVNRRPV